MEKEVAALVDRPHLIAAGESISQVLLIIFAGSGAMALDRAVCTMCCRLDSVSWVSF